MVSFYSNLHIAASETAKGDPTYHTHFIQDIAFTAKGLAKMLDVPNKGAKVYDFNFDTFEGYPEGENAQTARATIFGDPNKKFVKSAKEFPEGVRVLANVLGWCVIPKGSNRGQYTDHHLLATYCLIKNIKVNLPDLIIGCMIRTYSKQTSLGYGKIITKIMFENGIDLSKLGLPELKEDSPFGKKNVRLMKVDEDEEEEEEGEEGQGGEQEGGEEEARPKKRAKRKTPPARSGSGKASSSRSTLDHTELGARLEGLEHKVDAMHQENREFRKETRSTFGKIFSCLKTLLTCSGVPEEDIPAYEPPVSPTTVHVPAPQTQEVPVEAQETPQQFHDPLLDSSSQALIPFPTQGSSTYFASLPEPGTQAYFDSLPHVPSLQ